MVKENIQENSNINTDDRLTIGITHGDVNGIGYEVIIKAFAQKEMLESFTPVVYGSSKVASYHRKTLGVSDVNFNLVRSADLANPNRLNIVNITEQEVHIDLGKSTRVAGEMASMALDMAVEDYKGKHIDAIVTAPINKRNIQSENFKYPGHTEYFADKFDGKDILMLMVSDNLRIGMVTGHMPLKDVSAAITPEGICSKIHVLNHSLQRDMGIPRPKIAVLSLNPHAGDNGLLGLEDQEVVAPAVMNCFDEGILVYGPYPADGFFGSGQFAHFDGVLAMYHDQGLIAFKSLSFENGVNFTAGIDLVRTSPAHGTAYEIAGKNEASANSMRQALNLAADIVKNRREWDELHANPLKVNTVEEER